MCVHIHDDRLEKTMEVYEKKGEMRETPLGQPYGGHPVKERDF